MLKSLSLSLLLALCAVEARAQWAEQPGGVSVRLRGVSAVSGACGRPFPAGAREIDFSGRFG